MTSILAVAIKDAAVAVAPLHWYALADAAQRPELPGAVATNASHRCLFDASEGSPLAASAPHLVSMPMPSSDNRAWNWIERHASSSPCITMLASTLSFDELFAHLQRFTEVVLPDGEDMFFAFWDPAILGTLVGQSADNTLHVPGPALTPAQRNALLNGITAWWYWDREGGLQRINGSVAGAEASNDLPLRLMQAQVDMLVEASVPDHVLHYVRLNQAHLLDAIPMGMRYAAVRSSLVHARELGLSGMGDLVNFVCASLIYGDAMKTDTTISALLEKVRCGALTWDQTMDALP